MSKEECDLATNSTLKQLPISDEDRMRLNVYRLLARALSRPADQEFLDLLAGLEGDESELGTAFGELSGLAAKTSVTDAGDEYQMLFIGLGRGEILPYGSYYLTGFLNEKPLARLRNDMAQLGIERSPDVKDPEDHAGALMDMMAGLIDGSFGEPQSIQVQRNFFEKHVGNWTPYLFRDLQQAGNARFYKPFGKIGEVFMAVEEAAFAL